jgi:hypothetical protein
MIAKGKEMEQERRGCIVHLKDVCRYSILIPSLVDTKSALQACTNALGGYATVVQVSNKMHKKFKNVTVIYGVSLKKLAKRYSYFQNYQIPSSHLFMIEVQILMPGSYLLGKYSHLAFEMYRESKPSKGVADLKAHMEHFDHHVSDRDTFFSLEFNREYNPF